MPKCLRCGAGGEWIQGDVRKEPKSETVAAPKTSKRSDVAHHRLVRPLAERLARRAWSILNHDNDMDDGQPHNVAVYKALVTELKKELRANAGKRPNDQDQLHPTP